MQELSGREGSIDPIFVSVKQAAQALSLSPWVTYQLLDSGKLRGKYHGRRRLVYVTSIREYADSLSEVPTEESA